MASRNLRTKHGYSEINIVPLLDVLLVLVLIFMATAPIISQSIQVDLPETRENKQLTTNIDNSPVILEVAGVDDSSLIIDGERYEHLTEQRIIDLVGKQLSENPQTIFLVGGANNVPYEEIIKAIDILHSAGIKSVGLMTTPI